MVKGCQEKLKYTDALSNPPLGSITDRSLQSNYEGPSTITNLLKHISNSPLWNICASVYLCPDVSNRPLYMFVQIWTIHLYTYVPRWEKYTVHVFPVVNNTALYMCTQMCTIHLCTCVPRCEQMWLEGKPYPVGCTWQICNFLLHKPYFTGIN